MGSQSEVKITLFLPEILNILNIRLRWLIQKDLKNLINCLIMVYMKNCVTLKFKSTYKLDNLIKNK